MRADTGAHFDGPDYVPDLDKARLTGQILRVYACMMDGQWRTLDEIAYVTGDPEASVSAQLRHLRKEKFGSHEVRKRRRGEGKRGLWEYQLVVPTPEPVQRRLFG
jgi:predicted transcriptional regulator